MAPSLPTFDFRRLRLYVVRLPLFTRIVLVLITFFFVIELQHVWDVVQWGALIPYQIHFQTMYRLNSYPLIHSSFFHTLFNSLALVPLLERFEAEHGTLVTGAAFFGLLFTSALIPNTSFLGHLCSVSTGYIYGLGYLKILAPPEKILRWVEGKLNLLGRLPHYVSIDQKTYGRYGVLPTSNSSMPATGEGSVQINYLNSAQRLDP
ncbi:MAG: hypothetical protein Q9214_000102 [Letrouitia sp. 1 TL-2023]